VEVRQKVSTKKCDFMIPIHQNRGIRVALILGEACKQVKKTNYYSKKYIKEAIIILTGY